MSTFTFPSSFDNEPAHTQVKILMRNQRILDIRIDDSFAMISTKAVTGIHYMLSQSNLQWLLTYLQTGIYEDFGIFPNDRATTFSPTSQLMTLIEQGCNIARIPFLRETEAFVKLRGLFRFGKLYFSIRRSDEFMDYLNSKGL